jgi:hypothetical protein
MRNYIPRGVEVLVKKAAVDPAFKKTLLAKRGRAADEIALELSPTEAALLDAVSEDQLRAIIGRTKVSPRLRPAFLGYAAGAMLAALGAAAYAEEPEEWEMRTTGIDPEIPPKVYDHDINDPADIDMPEDAGVIYGLVTDEHGAPLPGATVEIDGLDRVTVSNRYGFYVLTPVPAGTYNLTFRGGAYETERRSEVEVKNGYKTAVSVKLFMDISDERVTGIRPDLP